MKFRKYYSTRKGNYSEENLKLARELEETQREPTKEEQKKVEYYWNRCRDYQEAINKLLGTDLFLMGMSLKTLESLYNAIKKIKEE